MKKRIIAAVLLLIICPFSSFSCNGDPGINPGGQAPIYMIHNPVTVVDSSGGVIIGYQVNSNAKNTFLQKYSLQGAPLWQAKGIELSVFTAVQGESQFVSLLPDGGNGGVTVIYVNNGEILGKKLDIKGQPIWQEADKNLSGSGTRSGGYFRIARARDNTTIISWKNPDNSVSIQKYNDDMDTDWPAPAIIEGVSLYDIHTDGDGNVFIMWKNKPGYGEGELFIQKLDSEGSLLWPTGNNRKSADGVLIDSLGLAYLGFGSPVTSDGTGGAIAARAHGELNSDGKSVYNSCIYIQRISAGGNKMWGESGFFLGASGMLPQVIGGKAENTLVYWTDSKIVYAQKLDMTGKNAWEKAIEVGHAGDNAQAVYYDAADDGAGGGVMVWNHSENGSSLLYAQRIDSEGNLLWGENGVRVSGVSPFWAGSKKPARVVPDGQGGFLFTWAGGENIRDISTSWAQRLDNTGQLLWGTDGIRLDN